MNELAKVTEKETFKEKLERENNESFDKWFKRNIDKEKITKQIEIANRKGEKQFKIRVDNIKNSYTRNRFKDKRIINRLSEMFEGINVGFDNEAYETKILTAVIDRTMRRYIIFYW